MRFARLLIAAAWLLASHSALVSAQDAVRGAPAPGRKRPRARFWSSRTFSSVIHQRQVPWSCSGTPVMQTQAGRSSTNPGPTVHGKRLRPCQARPIAVSGVEPHSVYRARLTGLRPGGAFRYRVRKGDAVVFSAEGRAPKGVDQGYRFVGLRGLRREHGRPEGDRLPGIPGEARLRDDTRRHRLRQRARQRVP